MNPKVSIILTTHGEAPYLKQAIGSVLAQTFEDWECIVAKDGIFKCDFHIGDALDCDRRFRTFEYPEVPSVPCRFAWTINRAVLRESRGEYLTYLCHDDLYLPWRLGFMYQALTIGRNYDVVFGKQQLLCEDEDKVTWLQAVREGSEDQPAGSVDHSSVMHRRECFEQAGGWDENAPPRYGDAYFWNRLQQAGYKFHCIPEVLDAHRFNPHSISWKEDHP